MAGATSSPVLLRRHPDSSRHRRRVAHGMCIRLLAWLIRPPPSGGGGKTRRLCRCRFHRSILVSSIHPRGRDFPAHAPPAWSMWSGVQCNGISSGIDRCLPLSDSQSVYSVNRPQASDSPRASRGGGRNQGYSSAADLRPPRSVPERYLSVAAEPVRQFGTVYTRSTKIMKTDA